jgi:hypothetical protein
MCPECLRRFVGRPAAEMAAVGCYRAAIFGRATEPRLPGRRGSRHIRVTPPPPGQDR